MLIKSVLNVINLLSEKTINGLYKMQDDILYRSMGFDELLGILKEKGFKPSPVDKDKPRNKRKDSVIYDFQREKERLQDIEQDNVQIYRKQKLPKNKVRGYFKSFSRSLNDFLSINFADGKNKVVVAFYKEPLKNLRGAKLMPLGWLINHYDNYDLPNDTYISAKNELEDRLYYNGEFLPFRSNDLTKYIKAVYINLSSVTSDRVEQLKKILSFLRKENIDIRYAGENIDFKDLTPLRLQRSISNKKMIVDKGPGDKPDKDKEPEQYSKWLKRKNKIEKLKKEIEEAPALEYLEPKK